MYTSLLRWNPAALVLQIVGNDGPIRLIVIDTALEQTDPVYIGNLTAVLELGHTQVISRQLATVNMRVQSNGESALLDVVPSALNTMGTAAAVLTSGPEPPIVPYPDAGATASFRWVYAIAGDVGATHAFSGTASVEGETASNTATSVQGEVARYLVTVTSRYAVIGTTNQTLVSEVTSGGGEVVSAIDFTIPSGFAYAAGNAIALVETVSIEGDTAITATFTWDEYVLTVNVDPEDGGSVSQDPEQATYHLGDVVTLTAQANSGWMLGSWSGALGGTTNPQSLTISGDTVVTATFQPETPVGPFTSLTISPKTSSILVGQSITYTAMAAGPYGTWDVSADADFSAEAGAGGSWTENNVFQAGNVGEWTVTVEYGGVTDTATLNIGR